MNIKELIADLKKLDKALSENLGKVYTGKITHFRGEDFKPGEAVNYVHASIKLLSSVEVSNAGREKYIDRCIALCSLAIGRYRNVRHALIQAKEALGAPPRLDVESTLPLVCESFLALAETELVAPYEYSVILNLLDEFELRGKL